jgi:hypothetical protein
MKRVTASLVSILLVAGCAAAVSDLGFGRDRGVSSPDVAVTEEPGDDVMRPRARHGDDLPAGETPQPDADGFIGETLASLGAPAEAGLWLRTGLVAEVREGRVERIGGESVTLELRPSGGNPGAGSQISLAAMQVLRLPLNELATLRVYVSRQMSDQ